MFASDRELSRWLGWLVVKMRHQTKNVCAFSPEQIPPADIPGRHSRQIPPTPYRTNQSTFAVWVTLDGHGEELHVPQEGVVRVFRVRRAAGQEKTERNEAGRQRNGKARDEMKTNDNEKISRSKQ